MPAPATYSVEIEATAPLFTTARSRRVTREMIAARTRELALRAGRIPPYVVQTDYEQAKRELTGETDVDRQDALINAAF